MKKVLCFILTLCTAAAVVSCGKSKSSDSKSVPETTASTAASTGSDDVFTNDGYTEKIMEKIKDMQVSDEPFEFKEHGELVVPEKDEKVLGSFANIPGVKVSLYNTLNVYDILNCDSFIVAKAAVEKIEEVYA